MQPDQQQQFYIVFKWFPTWYTVINCYTNTYLATPHMQGLFRVNETKSTKQQNRTTTTTVKYPNWSEANKLAIYKCS